MHTMRAVLSGQHYSNIKMLSPDGVIMCRLSQRRANWYLQRGLAEVEPDNAIRLKFTPNGLGANGHQFYTQEHHDICVVCGREDALSRHHCVPHCFRKHFPEDYKIHNWHDIVLLCDNCHNKYEDIAHSIKNEMIVISEEDYQLRKNTLQAIRHACALVDYNHRIPLSKTQEMRQFISEYLGVQEATDDDIIELALSERPSLLSNEDWKRVVESLESIDEFVRWWRQHFVDTMKPLHLISGWSVDAPVSRKDLDLISCRI